MEAHEKKFCGHGNDILAYLYNEAPISDREAFEMHLANCGTCIDNFAEISQARFPVYEWKKLEFEALPTPEIVIPFTSAAAQISWIGKLKAALSFNPGLSAAGAFAALLIAFGVGYTFLVESLIDVDVAEVVAPIPSVSPVRTAADQSKTSSDASITVEEELPRELPPIQRAKREVVPVRTERTAVRPKSNRKDVINEAQPRLDITVPVLSAVEDVEDDSLRLADMFDEIGTSE